MVLKYFEIYSVIPKYFLSKKVLLLIGPFETLYYHYISNFDTLAGPNEFVLGHQNPDGFQGMFSNFFRIIVLLFDITIPLHYFNFEFFNNLFNFNFIRYYSY